MMHACRLLLAITLLLIVYPPLYSYPTPKFDVNTPECKFITGDIVQNSWDGTYIIEDYNFIYRWYRVQFIVPAGGIGPIGTGYRHKDTFDRHYESLGNIYK